MPYNVLKVNGNCDINYICSENTIYTENDILNISHAGSHAPNWNTSTILLANFCQDTFANSCSIVDEIIGYKIQRLEKDYNKLYNVATVNNSIFSIEDYNVKGNKPYQYYIVPILLKDGIQILGSPISTDIIHPKWQGWSVIGINYTEEKNTYTVDYDNIWFFDLNAEESPIHPIYEKNYIAGFGQYPYLVQGNENYIEGGLSCLIGNVSCENYEGDDIDTLEKWRAFCADDKLKLLKTPKGYVIPCTIKGTTLSVNHNILEKITTISFNYVQMMDSKEISVYGVGGLHV